MGAMLVNILHNVAPYILKQLFFMEGKTDVISERVKRLSIIAQLIVA